MSVMYTTAENGLSSKKTVTRDKPRKHAIQRLQIRFIIRKAIPDKRVRTNLPTKI